jgi:hypothetical protein
LFLAKLDGVTKQVVQNLLNPSTVSLDKFWKDRIIVGSNLEFLFFRHLTRLDQVDDRIEGFLQVDILDEHFGIATL